MPEVIARGRNSGLAAPSIAADRAALIAVVKEWGYFDSVFKTQRSLLQGRRLLDIGMGGGPLSVSAIETAGCASYVGVDPKVGTNSVKDPRADKDRSLPAYHAFPYTPADITRIYPQIKLYADILENVKQKVRQHKVDMGYMASVTEHLEHLPEVFKTIWETLEPGAGLWFTHHGYHSWTGHHKYPRTVETWDRNSAEQNAVTDWKHLETGHPCYSDTNFNRVRLADLRKLVDKYFHVVEWRYTFNAADRLTPEIRQRHKKYTLEELLGRTVTVLATRRDTPLDTDLSNIPFHHPPETYLAEADHARDALQRDALYGCAFFAEPNVIGSHSDNKFGAAKVFAMMQPGDRIRLRKNFKVLEFTAAKVNLPAKGNPSVELTESIDATLFKTSHADWIIDAVHCWHAIMT